MAASDLLVILDFDRTVFDTHRYYLDFLEMITATRGADFSQRLRAAEAASQYFDPFAYLAERGITAADTAADFQRFHAAKYSGQAGGSYLFADAASAVTTLGARPDTTVAIITTGSLQSQRFKLSLCPELQHLPHQIIPGNKGIHLQQDIDAHQAVMVEGQAYRRIALVDDRDDVLMHVRPHQDHQLFHIVRPGSKYQPTISRPDITEISSLTEISDLLL